MAAPFEEWFRNMPLVTRSFMTGCVVTTLAVHLELVNPWALYLNFHVIFHHWQVWRLVTNFLFFDYFGLNFIFHMYFLVRHSKILEERSFRGRTADFLFMWIFGAVMLILIDLVFYYSSWLPKVMFLAPCLAFMVVYIWSRRNVNMRMSFLGLFTFNAPYLPWVILGFGTLLGQSPVSDLLGLAVGHLYYFLEDVYPNITGRKILKTPTFLKQMFDPPADVVVDNAPGPNHQQQQQRWGDGRVLGE